MVKLLQIKPRQPHKPKSRKQNIQDFYRVLSTSRFTHTQAEYYLNLDNILDLQMERLINHFNDNIHFEGNVPSGEFLETMKGLGVKTTSPSNSLHSAHFSTTGQSPPPGLTPPPSPSCPPHPHSYLSSSLLLFPRNSETATHGASMAQYPHPLVMSSSNTRKVTYQAEPSSTTTTQSCPNY